MIDKHLIVQIVLSVAVVIGGSATGYITCVLLDKFGASHQIRPSRTLYLQKFIRYMAGILILLGLCLVWGVNLEGAWVVVTSLFGIIGIALFAQWSILSNITACFILFFSSPFKIDDYVTVKDGDNSVTGQVLEMTLFYIRLVTADEERVNIPNNLVFQKTVITHNRAPVPAPE